MNGIGKICIMHVQQIAEHVFAGKISQFEREKKSLRMRLPCVIKHPRQL